MDFNKSFCFEKSKNESTRIPSPASVSSVHSIRPLEWDSGADIGYEFKHQTGLSTVERIALESRTVNLLGNCVSQNIDLYANKSIGNPLAQSSPFAVSVELEKEAARTPIVNKNALKPLVDYSISEYSYDEKIEEPETETPVKTEVLCKRHRTSNLRGDESSKSLDDLRCLERTRSSKKSSSSRSRSSQNLLIAVHKNSSERNSSSSLATLVPSTETFLPRKCSNKSVQVDEKCLEEIDAVLPKSSLEFFRRICYEEANDNDSRNACSKKNSNSENDEASVDKGSFEYVPGSRYVCSTLEKNHSSDSGSKNSSSVNTFCSEVTDGVALLTKYVNDLKVSNKRRIMEKVAKSLVNNLRRLENSSSNFRISNLESNSSLTSNPKVESKSESYSKMREPNLIESGLRTSSLENDSKSSSSNYLESGPSTNGYGFPTSESKSCVSSEYNSLIPPTNLNSPSYSYKVPSSCRSTSNSDPKSSNPGTLSLKEYLKRERDAQLLWIKSNINHLNNLRKLYESQKLLQSELNELKKSGAFSRSVGKTSEIKISETRSPRKKHTKSLDKSRFIRKARKSLHEQTSCTTTSCGSYGVSSTLEGDNRTPLKTVEQDCFEGEKLAADVTDAEICQCLCKHCCRTSNKENMFTNAKHCEKIVSGRRSNNFVSSRPPISYTILFGKGPNFNIGKNFKVKEYVERKSVSKATNREKKVTKTKSVTKLQSTSDERIVNQSISLQEHLINNRPEYVHRAEYRRQCLGEIAKLRELRDKSREELLSAVRNVDEMNDAIGRSLKIPPPLSVVRLFDDKTIKKETERKYQQLPEVLNKKLESKRKDTYRRNHIMAKIFNKRLQKKVLQGRVNLANNVNVVSV